MPKKPETYFGIKVDKHLKQMPSCWFINVQMVALRGIPDRIGVINGKFFALELKVNETEGHSNTGRINLQKYILKQIQKAGGFAEITWPERWPQTLKKLKEFAA